MRSGKLASWFTLTQAKSLCQTKSELAVCSYVCDYDVNCNSYEGDKVLFTCHLQLPPWRHHFPEKGLPLISTSNCAHHRIHCISNCTLGLKLERMALLLLSLGGQRIQRFQE